MSTTALLASMPDVRVLYTDDERALKGREARWYPKYSLIVIAKRLKRLKARCRLAHELGHVVLGHPTPCGIEFFDQRVELEADEFAARLLLSDLDALAFEMATACGRGHAAANLFVTLDLYETRLATLLPREAARLEEKVSGYQDGMGA